jgi:predicted dehydrogenase
MSHNIENWQQTIAGTWRDDPESNPGGFIGDAGSHKIDAVFFVTGLQPTEVFARCDQCGSHVEITSSISGLLEGNVPLTMDFVGHTQHFNETLAIHCERADLTLREGEIWIGRDTRAERFELGQPDCNPVVAFLDALLDGAENFAPPECALPVFDFTQAIFESARSGRSIALGGE